MNLLGFADAVGGAQLVKTEDGKISWVKPDTTTVEGLSTAIESLKTVVGDDKSGLVKQVADNKTAIDKLMVRAQRKALLHIKSRRSLQVQTRAMILSRKLLIGFPTIALTQLP